jgi:Ca-activated chloride channel family protein
VVALLAGLARAWSTAGSFADLWLTPDQQGARLLARERYAEAAQRFRDPMWRGVALYRAGEFEEAAAAFARRDTARAAFDRGNALVMAGKYDDAIASYDRALERRPQWRKAEANRALARLRKAKMAPPADDGAGTGGQVAPDAITFDERGKQGTTETQEEGGRQQLSDAQVQSLWLRRVQTKPADFLRAKFAYQLSQQGREAPAP